MIAWLLACADAPNHLQGSLAETFDLAFDATRARLYDRELSVEYVDLERGGRVAVRLTLREPETLSPGPWDLLARGDVGVTDEVSGQLPPLVDGAVVLQALDPVAGGAVVGTFHATFETPDERRLLVQGAFDTVLELVDAR